MMMQFIIYILKIIEIHNCLFWGNLSNLNFISLGFMIVFEIMLEYIKSKHSTEKNSVKFLYSFAIVFCMVIGCMSTFWLVSPKGTVLWWPLFAGFCLIPNVLYNNKIISKKKQPWNEKPKWEKNLIILTTIIMIYTIYQVVILGVDFFLGGTFNTI